MHGQLLSSTMLSNLFSMGVASRVDPRQAIPPIPGTVPTLQARELRAKLIVEEALETCSALGVRLRSISPDGEVTGLSDLDFKAGYDFDLADAIDGCCDTIYVCVGTLAAFGVPDLPHLDEVNRANNAKFPGGVATFNASGKYLKPPGWTPPDHRAIMETYAGKLDLSQVAAGILEQAALLERAKCGEFE